MTTREWLLSAALAAVPPLTVLAMVFGIFQTPVEFWVRQGDGEAYLAVARTMIGGPRPPDPFWERAFLGWPALLTPAVLTPFPFSAGVVTCVLFALWVPGLVYLFTRDRVLAILSAAVPPVWILQASMAMTESAYMVFLLGALILHLRGRTVPAAVLMGLAGLIRPMAVFAWCGVAYDLWMTGRRRDLALWVGVSSLLVAFTPAVNWWLWDAPLRQFDLYSTLPNLPPAAREQGLGAQGAGHIGWPFRSVVMTPLQVPVPKWKVVYVWAHLGTALLACGVGFANRAPTSTDRICLVWAVLNTLFIASTGPYWAFMSFDRYWVWAGPAYMYLLRNWLPRSPVFVGGIVAVSIFLACAAKWNILAELARAGE